MSNKSKKKLLSEEDLYFIDHLSEISENVSDVDSLKDPQYFFDKDLQILDGDEHDEDKINSKNEEK